jgi:hypothetical protein
MVPPTKDEPSNVIPLSAFRAELGRGRRLRRADALLADRDPDAAVRALPGDELYYVLHELGHEDAGALLAAATAEQLQVVLDFAVWQRDRLAPDALAEWVEAMAHASPERIARWLAGLDAELVALILRKGARIYDITQGPAPEESEGTFFPTPDGFFVLDVVGLPREDGTEASYGDENDRAAVIIRLVDSLYRGDKDLARRLLVAATGELDSDLEETAYRWQRGRMEDLGFADYYEALEVYREIDLSSVRIGEVKQTPLRTTADAAAGSGDALRVPTALAQRLSDVGGSPFARAAQKLAARDEIEELRFALVALTNRVLAADRIAPGDDDAVAATLQRLAATLDLAIERLAPGDDDRGSAALRTIPLVRLFRAGVTMIGKVRRLALALLHHGPFGRQTLALAEPEDAAVLESLARTRPLYLRLLDQPPATGERPFQSLADLARAAAAVERAAAAQAMLSGLGVEPQHIAPGSPILEEGGIDAAAIDAGLLARTILVKRLRSVGGAPTIAPLDPREVTAFESELRRGQSGPVQLPPAVAKRARALLEAAAPSSLAGAAVAAVADRWIAGLAPLEPVLVARAPAAEPRPRRTAAARPREGRAGHSAAPFTTKGRREPAAKAGAQKSRAKPAAKTRAQKTRTKPASKTRPQKPRAKPASKTRPQKPRAKPAAKTRAQKARTKPASKTGAPKTRTDPRAAKTRPQKPRTKPRRPRRR